MKQVFIDDYVFSVISSYEDGNGVDVLSVFLTSYFEDLISETNIWNSFIKTHKELYHKPLPFYSTEEYYEDEINVADIAFLIWYFLSTIQNDLTIAPFADFILKNAKSIYKIFDDAWDSAPVNEILKAHYTIGENETDYYVARNFIDNILFKTYLFYPDTSLMLRDDEMELIEYSKSNCNTDSTIHLLNAQRDENLHRFHTKLLALSGKEWAIKILGDVHPMRTHFTEMSKKTDGYFFYINRAKLYFLLNQLELANNDVDKAMDIDSSNGYYYYIKSQIYLKKHNTIKACEFYKKAAEYGYKSSEQYKWCN